jgi:hypothetical protein
VMSRQALKSTRLAVILQIFPFLLLPQDAILISFGSPEHFVSIFSMLLVGLTLKLHQAQSNQLPPKSFPLLLTGLLCALAFTSKFTAAPLAALPFFLVHGARTKLMFCGYLALFTALIFLPILSNLDNLRQLYWDLKALLFTINHEGASTARTLLAIIHQAFTRFPIHYQLISVTLTGTVLIFAILAIMDYKSRGLAFAKNKKAIFFTLLTLMLTLVMISIRAKWHYFAPYLPLVGLVVILLIDSTCGYFKQNPSLASWASTGTFMASLIIGSLFITSINLGYTQLHTIKRGTEASIGIESINRKILEEDGSAVITAVQASTPAGAFDHANQTSRFIYRNEIASLFPGQYTYPWDGFSARTFDGLEVSIYDLLNYHPNLYFQTTLGNFHVDRPNLSVPQIIAKTIAHGGNQYLVKVIAVAEQTPTSASSGNSSQAWERINCRSSESGLCLARVISTSKCLSHIAIEAAGSAGADHLGETIQLDGSNNLTEWSTILDAKTSNNLTYHRDPTVKTNAKALVVPSDIDYQAYRVVIPIKTASPNSSTPVSVKSFIHRGCNQKSTGITRLLKSPKRAIFCCPFWEKRGSYPFTWTRRVNQPITPISYMMTTANHGENGIDSWGRMPSSWSLHASVDGITWKAIHTVHDQPKWRSNEKRIFEIEGANEPYNYFRLQAFDGWNKDIIRIESVAIFGK